MRILPVSALARVAVVLSALGLAAYVLLLVLAESWLDDQATPALGFGAPLLAMLVGAVLALVALRRGDRSLLTVVALVPGALVVLALLAELTGVIE